MTAPAEIAPVNATAWVAARLAAPTEALEIQTVEIPVPGPGEVRIAVKAFCLDFNDIDTIYGRYFLLPFQPPFVPGMAAAGVVDAAGPGAETLLGKRVVGTTVGAKGSYATAALLGASSVQLVPSWLSFTDAAAMYFPYLLGWLAIRTRARVQAGDVVLVHAAAGGIGSGVVQLAKAFGATVIATAGTDEKVKFCYDLGADYAVNYSGRELPRLRQRRHQRTWGQHRLRHDRRTGHPGHVQGDGLQRPPSHRGLLGRHRSRGTSGQPAARHLRQFRRLRRLFRLRRFAPGPASVRHELHVDG